MKASANMTTYTSVTTPNMTSSIHGLCIRSPYPSRKHTRVRT